MLKPIADLLRRTNLLAGAAETPLVVAPYRGFANPERFYLTGRVLERQGVYEGESDSLLRNLADNLRRIETDEVPGAKVVVELAGQQFHAVTDAEGYYTLDLPWAGAESDSTWLPAAVRLLETPNPAQLPVEPTPSEVLLPSANACFGIISDVDDTVLQTHVTSTAKFRMLLETFLNDSHQRQPMEGMSELLPALAAGGLNPIFYVSDSPWNLYDLLTEFLRKYQLPKGPLLLRDYGLHMLRRSASRPVHKLESFRRIMDMYPGLPFVMLGDTASKDADYYLQMAREYPGRVLAIYIRLTRNNANAKRVAQLVAEQPQLAVMVRSADEIGKDMKRRGLLA